jgi:hypothetical protein
MGRLTGFRYREAARKLRAFGYLFDRQGPGGHEVWRATLSLTTKLHFPPCARYRRRHATRNPPRSRHQCQRLPEGQTMPMAIRLQLEELEIGNDRPT